MNNSPGAAGDGVVLARRLINLDSEEEGILTVSCAGGARCDLKLSLPAERKSGIICEILVLKIVFAPGLLHTDHIQMALQNHRGRILTAFGCFFHNHHIKSLVLPCFQPMRPGKLHAVTADSLCIAGSVGNQKGQ